MEKNGGAIFIPICFSSFFIFCFSYVASQNHSIPAIYVFGDSTADPGNNNRLVTANRGDHKPYGLDFNGGIATGRLTNGKLVMDMVASILGIKDSLPAYFDTKNTNHDLLTGVSFASAGTGMDDLTAKIGGVTRMSTQLVYLQECLGRIKATVGNASAAQIIQNALFTIGVGTNDMLFNYYDLPTRKLQFTEPVAYHDFLLGKFEIFVTGLYKMGARKILITSLPPIGCLPAQVSLGSLRLGPHILERKCVDQQNKDTQTYNAKLQGYITRWQATLHGAKFSYADIYNPLMDMILNPNKYGFEETLRGCCGTGYIELGPLCNSNTPVCSDRSKFVFFDSVHPTQVVYEKLANIIHQTVLPRLVN